MQAIVIDRPGGYARLRLETLPDPLPGPGEVALAVEAVAINYANWLTRMGLYASARRYVGYPIVPGFEVAGRVAACGAGVEDLPPGTPVLAVTRFGDYASRVVVPRARGSSPSPSRWRWRRRAGWPWPR